MATAHLTWSRRERNRRASISVLPFLTSPSLLTMAGPSFFPSNPRSNGSRTFRSIPETKSSPKSIGSPGSSPTLSGAFGVFVLENLTTSQYTSIYTPVGSTRSVAAKPCGSWNGAVGGSLPDLADYGSATMLNAYARKANSPRGTGYIPYQGARSRQITMFNASDTLSTVTPIDTYSMQFNWEAFH